MIKQLRSFFEKNFFGVCDWWGDKLGVKSSRIRIFFIYTSCLAMGSPIIIYLSMAFVLENKEWFKNLGRKRIWEL